MSTPLPALAPPPLAEGPRAPALHPGGPPTDDDRLPAAPVPDPTALLSALLGAEVEPAPPLPTPTAAELGQALLGFVALPLVGLLGDGGAGGLAGGVAPPLAALALSVPSLLVGHQFLGLQASPAELARDVVAVFTRCGRLALALVPVVGLYAATSGLGPTALVLALTCIGIASVSLARQRLMAREAAAGPAAPGAALRMALLATAWAALALLVGARMGVDLLHAL